MGMRQRLAIAAALLETREVLILDEPTNGLDPPGIRWMRELLRAQAGRGRAVLVSSHLLAEVAQSVDELVVISKGPCGRAARSSRCWAAAASRHARARGRQRAHGRGSARAGYQRGRGDGRPGGRSVRRPRSWARWRPSMGSR